eukprot:TRINITY_DN13628_c0_g1_i1.p1 TRINITY_DN13628_c0_g1~~TRINITY_DN13628_c0_g1_i1.p1  ORF type:complete len:473 (+),score=59.49 TRINITY_DN13628_c0_g1_i1:35-1420(+)
MLIKRWVAELCVFDIILSGLQPAKCTETWSIGPWTRPDNPQPVLRPNASSSFYCPMRQQMVEWEARHTFNPAAVVKDGKVHVLYRAEDNSSKGGIGSFTSRIGLAVSNDGINFERDPLPVLFPGPDSQADHEYYGGCEDPRIAERPDGTYVLLYTQFSRQGPRGTHVRLGLASSRDLRTWTKHGSPFEGTKFQDLTTKSASIVQRVQDGRLIAALIYGRYWMYFGEHAVNIATSEDLIHWKVETDGNGKPKAVMSPRPLHFDSHLTEVGPSLVLTERGIILTYNGKNSHQQHKADPALPLGVYTCGQALFARGNPMQLLHRMDAPFLKPEVSWEKSGQYKDGTTFSEGLVLFQGRWMLYYGCADTFVGVATAPFSEITTSKGTAMLTGQTLSSSTLSSSASLETTGQTLHQAQFTPSRQTGDPRPPVELTSSIERLTAGAALFTVLACLMLRCLTRRLKTV